MQTDGTEEKWGEFLKEKEEETSLSPSQLSPISSAVGGSSLPFADPVWRCLQHACDGVGDGGPAQL